MTMEGAIAIVTGAGQGQGRATAELLAASGAIVYAADISPTEYGPDSIRHRELDIGEETAWSVLVEEIVAAEGRIDALVNNAGITGVSGPFSQTTLVDWNKVLQTNLTGTFLGMRAVLPQMREQGDGAVVNVASIVALSPVPFVAPYHASKGGIRVISKHAALEYAPFGVRVNLVLPGIIDTPMMAASAEVPGMGEALVSAIPTGRVGDAIEVARASLFLVGSDASYITGAELTVDGGASIHTALAAGQLAAISALTPES